MSSKVQEPSKAERLEDVAVAGPGAEEKGDFGLREPEQAPNGSVETPSDQSDELVDPNTDAGEEKKTSGPPQAPQRSKSKITLIMGSILVRKTPLGKVGM